MDKAEISEFFNDTLTYIDNLEEDSVKLRNEVRELLVRVKSLESTVEDQKDKVYYLENRTAAEILNLERPEQELFDVAEAAIADLGYWRFLQILQDVQARLAKYYITEHA